MTPLSRGEIEDRFHALKKWKRAAAALFVHHFGWLRPALYRLGDLKSFARQNPIGLEPSPIPRNDLIYAEVVRVQKERGIGEIHQRICVFLSQRYSGIAAAVGRRKPGRPPTE